MAGGGSKAAAKQSSTTLYIWCHPLMTRISVGASSWIFLILSTASAGVHVCRGLATHPTTCILDVILLFIPVLDPSGQSYPS